MYDETGRPRFYADPGVDRLTAVVMRLASELWVARERVDTLERLAGLAGKADGFEPDAAASEQREAARQAFIQTVFAPLRESGAAGANPVP